ncbi:uncharacterized protein HGUI_01162 [Hanseniaspora guilliermondii]|uniref:Muniscin C-terminal domain-containing protein n=1 Tax=Hanseniaspora guilliermondii TaxID=56406 RepID=A0A1L0AXM7_9ASCO|nr:uncharacterized protein HGUI_01162 [Hanseniaspora guilliermondii]
MNTEHNSEEIQRAGSVYTDRILTQKLNNPQESLELIKLKLTTSKIYNEQFVKLLKQVSIVKRTHHQQLKKIYNDNEAINDIVFDRIAKEADIDISTLAELFSNGDLVGKDINKQMYGAILEELRTEMNHTAKFETVLNEKFITSLDNYDSNNLQTKETWNLLKHLLSGEISNESWQNNGPLLFDMFEQSDFERLSFLKQTLLDFEVLVGQYEVALTNKNQATYNKIFKFSPEAEIDHFANYASNTSFKSLIKADSTTNSKSHHRNQSIQESTKSIRHPSSSTVLKHDLIHSNFTNSNNNGKVESGKKEKNKLRSKFGTLFGKKNKNKHASNQSSENLSERENTSSSAKQPKSLGRRPSNIAEISSSNNYDSPSNSLNPTHDKDLPKAPEIKYSSDSQPQAYPEHYNQSSLAQAGIQRIEDDSPLLVSDSQNESQLPVTTSVQVPSNSESSIVHAEAPSAPRPRKSNKRVQSQLFQDLNVSARESVYLNNNSQDLEPQLTGAGSEVGNSTPQFVHPEVLPVEDAGDTTLGAEDYQVDLKDIVVNSSIAEVINYARVASTDEDEHGDTKYTENIDLVGELALSLPSSINNVNLPADGLNLKLNKSGLIEDSNLIYNSDVLTPNEGKNEYNVVDINKLVGKSVGLLKYQASNLSPSLYKVPVTVASVWNHEDTKSSMVLSVKNNTNKILEFQTCTVSIQILDCQVSQVLSKPNGVFNKKKQKIIWRFKDENNKLVFEPEEERKFIVRFITDKKGREGKCNIEFSMFGYNGLANGSSFVAPKLLTSNKEEVNMDLSTSLISGKYFTI